VEDQTRIANQLTGHPHFTWGSRSLYCQSIQGQD
jgi:hypothetical protein